MNTTTDTPAADQATALYTIGVYIDFGASRSLETATSILVWAMSDGAILLASPKPDNPKAAPEPGNGVILPGVTAAELSAIAQRLDGGAS